VAGNRFLSIGEKEGPARIKNLNKEPRSGYVKRDLLSQTRGGFNKGPQGKPPGQQKWATLRVRSYSSSLNEKKKRGLGKLFYYGNKRFKEGKSRKWENRLRHQPSMRTLMEKGLSGLRRGGKSDSGAMELVLDKNLDDRPPLRKEIL